MKLATFTESGLTRCGVVDGEEIIDLGAVPGIPADMCALLAGGVEAVGRALRRDLPRLALADVRLEPPVRPAKFMAAGLNARDHRREITPGRLARNLHLVRLGLGSKLAHPRSRYPMFFAKATSSITGPYDPIWSPADSPTADFEGEVCAVIGRRCHRLTAAEAARAVAGYTITNDVSVRAWQLDSPMGPILAKGYPTHGPLGPWIVTSDERPGGDFELCTFVNGRQRQHGSTGDLIRTPLQLVAILSRFCVLEPGDLIATGTFAGVGLFERRWLAPGDTVRVEVDGIGHIENRVSEEPPRRGLLDEPAAEGYPALERRDRVRG